MFRTRRQVALLAIVFGLAAAGVTAYYTSRVTEASQATERLVVARANIPARTTVTEDMLMTKPFPKGAMLPTAHTSMAGIVGKTTKQPIFAGEQVLGTRFFADRVESGLAFVIPPGRRAVSVGINELTGAGGHIAAGDKVDLMGICRLTPQAGGSTELTKAIFALQGVEVLAVARKVVGEEEGSALQASGLSTGGSGAKPPVKASQEFTAKSVTLSLTPQEAESVLLLEASSACEIRFALRAAGDQDRVVPREAVFDAAQPLTSVQAR